MNDSYFPIVEEIGSPDTIVLSNITGRTQSLFDGDIRANNVFLHEKIRRARILVIGAAGSVGSAFVRQVVSYEPRVLHLIDCSENNLVELVRDLRSTPVPLPDDFVAAPVALGSLEMEHFLDAQKPYNYILNFSALKHVRSEKDPYSLMRMYNTNVFHVKELLQRLIRLKQLTKFFSVSSDKAVNPHNIMGATKIFMERVHILFSDSIPFSTARFANVAFSDGSLLHGFRLRFEKKQPISAPVDTLRYFITHEEAGQLCLLSCFLGENRDVFFPHLDPSAHLVSFSDIATQFLQTRGYEPDVHASEEEAKECAEHLDPSSRIWPCYFFNSDTTGEKPYEEFYTNHDNVSFERFNAIGIINRPGSTDSNSVLQAIERFEHIKRKKIWNKEDMVAAIKIAVPELHHVEKSRNLDQRM